MLLHFAAVSVRGTAAGPAPAPEEQAAAAASPRAARERTPPHAVFLRATFDGGGGSSGSGNASANAAASSSSSSSPPSDAALAAFCLPLGADHQAPLRRMAAEEFCFALTRGNGARVYGFCRRFLPPSPPTTSSSSSSSSSSSTTTTIPRYPAVLCLLSPLPWGEIFWRALEAVEEMLVRGGGGDQQQQQQQQRGPTAAAAAAPPAHPLPLLQAQLPHADAPVVPRLPEGSAAHAFLAALSARLAERPPLGAPLALGGPSSSPSSSSPPLLMSLPRDAGNGRAASGVALSRLLWHVRDPRALTSVLASLLLERRVVFVARSRDSVSAACLAAAALLYPLRWRHLFLPILPRSFREYLTAPMPFLAGVPAPLLPALRGLPTERAVTVDLDTGSVTAPPPVCEGEGGGDGDDGARLPWREDLEAALAAALERMSSPTEHEVSGLVSAVVQGYLIRLLGGYRAFVRVGFGAAEGAQSSGGGGDDNNTRRREQQQQQQRQLQRNLSAQMPTSASACLLVRDRDPNERRRASVVVVASELPPSPSSSSPPPPPPRDASALLGPRGSWFDHGELVASHGRNPQARSFLRLLRGSQMYQAFVEERLARAAAVAAAEGPARGRGAAVAGGSADAAVYERPYGEDDADGQAGKEVDPFEARVTAHLAAVRGRRGAGAATAAEAAEAAAKVARRQRRSPFPGGGSPRHHQQHQQQQTPRPMSALGGGGGRRAAPCDWDEGGGEAGSGGGGGAGAAAATGARPRSAPPTPSRAPSSNVMLTRMAQALHRLVRRGEDGGGGGKGQEKKDEQQQQQQQQQETKEDEERRRRFLRRDDRRAQLLARARAAASSYARDAAAGVRAGGADPAELERQARQAALVESEEEMGEAGAAEEEEGVSGSGAGAPGVSPVLDPTGLLPRAPAGAARSRPSLLADDEEAMILLLAAARPPAPPLAEESWGRWTEAPPLPPRRERERARQQQQEAAAEPAHVQLSHRERLLLAVHEGFRAAAGEGPSKSSTTSSGPGAPGGTKSERA